MDRIAAFLHSAGWFAFSTTDGTRPHVRPFGSVMVYDGKMYMCMGDYKKVYKQLEGNNSICICALAPDGDSWIRIYGRAQFDKRPEVTAAMYEHEPALREIYEKQGLELAVFYIEDGKCEFHDQSDDFETVSF